MTLRRFRSSCPVAVVVLLLALLIPPLTVESSGKCKLVRSLRDEIASYRPVVDRVLSYVQDKNGYKGRTWAALSEFTDTFGSRLAGTANLENSIDFMMNTLRNKNLDNVHAERVMFTGWQRYKLYCYTPCNISNYFWDIIIYWCSRQCGLSCFYQNRPFYTNSNKSDLGFTQRNILHSKWKKHLGYHSSLMF